MTTAQQSAAFEEFLAGVSARDRANIEKHLAALEAEGAARREGSEGARRNGENGVSRSYARVAPPVVRQRDEGPDGLYGPGRSGFFCSQAPDS